MNRLDTDMEIGVGSAPSVTAPVKCGDVVTVRSPGNRYSVVVIDISNDGRKITTELKSGDTMIFSLIGKSYRAPFGEQMILP